VSFFPKSRPFPQTYQEVVTTSPPFFLVYRIEQCLYSNSEPYKTYFHHFFCIQLGCWQIVFSLCGLTFPIGLPENLAGRWQLRTAEPSPEHLCKKIRYTYFIHFFSAVGLLVDILLLRRPKFSAHIAEESCRETAAAEPSPPSSSSALLISEPESLPVRGCEPSCSPVCVRCVTFRLA
jgi:hypothetical protein